MERITSRKNKIIVNLRSLGRDTEMRREQGLFLCDGAKLLEEAVCAGAEIETVLWKEGGTAPAMLTGVDSFFAPAEVFEAASPMINSPGPVFTVRIPDSGATDAPHNAIILENVQDPGNVGTVIRTANAFGIGAVLLVGSCADVYSPKTVRSTMGALFRQRVERHTLSSLAQALKNWKLTLVGAVLSNRAQNILMSDLTGCAVAVGSEGNGLSPEMVDLCQSEIIIPMQPDSESLNAAVAASIIMWEMRGRTL